MCEFRALEDASREMGQPGQLDVLVADGPDFRNLGQFEDIDPLRATKMTARALSPRSRC